MTELEALAVLTTIPRLGPIKIRLLLQHFGSATQALEASSNEIEKLPSFGENIGSAWKTWRQNRDWRENLDLAAKLGVKLIPYTSASYPKRLLEIADFPVLLYVLGEIKAADLRSLAIVGTRFASEYGLASAQKLGQELAEMGFSIVSGLALGIDTAAHKGALQTGRTIAVIGSGLNHIYPSENADLAKRISERGALISEFPMTTPPERQNFPQRNRIVSGMTLGTVLIEAPLKSGAMITVEKALTQKRRTYALPGRTDQETFKGNHHLIKNGRAALIENAQDVAESFESLFSIC